MQVVSVLEKDFFPIVKRQSLSGRAKIRTDNKIFMEGMALDMALDVFSERGFHVVLDVSKVSIPDTFDLKTGMSAQHEHGSCVCATGIIAIFTRSGPIFHPKN